MSFPTTARHILIGVAFAFAFQPAMSMDKTDKRLFEACRSGDVANVRAAINAGADVNARYPRRRTQNTAGATPLMVAARGNSLAVVELLIESGASVNASDDEHRYTLQSSNKGKTALMAAAKTNEPRVVETLIEHRAEVNAGTANGWTALHSAARFNDAEMVKTLLEAGADASRVGGYRRKTAADLARNRDSDVIRKSQLYSKLKKAASK